MPRNQRSDVGAMDVLYTVDDDMFEELAELAGAPIAGISLWEDSITDALGQGELTGSSVDLDLYLSSGVYFELYGVLCYPNLDSEPLQGIEVINERIAQIMTAAIHLEEVAVDEEDSLVLVLGHSGQALIFLNAGAWALGEWEELPEHVHVPSAPDES